MNQPRFPRQRPEDRRRDGSTEFEWPDTLPQCFRSEGFAEDLLVAEAPLARAAAQPRLATLATLPLLGATVAAVLGLMGR